MFAAMRAAAVVFCWVVAAASANGQAPGPAGRSLQEDWCDGLGNVPDDVQISACTTVIAAGRGGAARMNTAYFNRGLTYAQTGRCRLALADFTAAIRNDPKDADAYWARHMCKQELGDAAGAAADRKAAQAIDPRIEEQWQH